MLSKISGALGGGSGKDDGKSVDMESVRNADSGIDAVWKLEKLAIADQFVAALTGPHSEIGIYILILFNLNELFCQIWGRGFFCLDKIACITLLNMYECINILYQCQ